MQIFVINLDQDTDRLSFMRAQLSDRFGLGFERFRAVLGAALTGEDLAYRQTGGRERLNDAEAGCLLSHIEVWRRIAEGEADAALILEDDVHCAESFPGILAAAGERAPAPEIQRLETVFARVTVGRRPVQRWSRHGLHRLHTNHAGGAAYVMSRPAARIALQAVAAFQNPPDVELFDPVRGAVRGLRILQWVPAPCVQDQWLAKGARMRFESHLAAQGRLDGPEPQDKAWKKALRPAYTALYGGLLAPFGRNRLEPAWG